MKSEMSLLIDEQHSAQEESLSRVVLHTNEILSQEGIDPDTLQWKILINHLDAMISRGQTGEKLPEMDEELFAELSKESLNLALEIMKQVENLAQSEKFLLAMHIENARENKN